MKNQGYPLKVWMKYTPYPIKRKAGGQYEFTLNNPITLPLIAKDTKLFPDDVEIISFEYTTSDYVAYLGASVMQNLIYIRNINVSDQWQNISIDLSKYAATLHRNILGRNMASLRLHIAPLPSSGAVRLKIRNLRLRAKNRDEQSKQVLKDTYTKAENQRAIDLFDYLLLMELPCKISSVQVDSQLIRITGETCPADSELYLCIVVFHRTIYSLWRKSRSVISSFIYQPTDIA